MFIYVIINDIKIGNLKTNEVCFFVINLLLVLLVFCKEKIENEQVNRLRQKVAFYALFAAFGLYLLLLLIEFALVISDLKNIGYFNLTMLGLMFTTLSVYHVLFYNLLQKSIK
ncbi:MAG: hypothetical protein EAZ08_01455 [Cytophagales bacterium]|nr:MAG: hypothetical protein EAZ08_01455 [Cytophagales bacterium]